MATVFKEPGAELNYDMSDASWYVEDRWQEPFRQMRAQDPIHWTEGGMFGDFWNVTSHKAIQHVEALPEIFSSSYEHGGITLADRIDDGTELVMPMFIAMDRPKHTGQRRTVAPAFTPTEMKRMSDDIRRRTAEILDGLPWDQPFDWVDKVSIELTTQMLAILFDFPGRTAASLPNGPTGRAISSWSIARNSAPSGCGTFMKWGRISRSSGTRRSTPSPRPTSSR